MTAVGSYRLRRNATVLLTGHASGELRLHLLEQQPPPAAASAAASEAPTQQQLLCGAWEAKEEGCGAAPLTLSLLEAFAPEAVLCSFPPAVVNCSSGQQAGACAAGCAPISVVLGAGRGGGTVAATAVVADALGRLAVLKHGGPTGAGGEFEESCWLPCCHFGVADVPLEMPNTCQHFTDLPPLCCTHFVVVCAARLVRQVALEQQPLAMRPPTATATTVLGTSGAASQRLSQPTAKPAGAAAKQPQQGSSAAEVPPRVGFEAPAFKPCRDLGGSGMVAAACDAQHATRAYALTDDGQLLALVVGGEKGTHASCIVKAAAPLPTGLLPSNGDGGKGGSVKEQLALATIPGYLLVVTGGQLSVFNASSAPRAAPRLLLQQQLAALRAQFGVAAAAGGPDAPFKQALLVASQQGHVALTLNATVLALYQTAFPYRPALKAPMKGGLAVMQVTRQHFDLIFLIRCPALLAVASCSCVCCVADLCRRMRLY